MTLMRDIEPTLQAMQAVDREKLSENEHKGHWRGATAMALMDRLYDEVFELAQAVRTESPRAVAREAADVRNFAMMVADVMGGLDA